MMLAPYMSMLQLQNTDYNDAMTIQSQMQADNQRSQMDRWKILQDTQTKINELMQEVSVFKAQAQEKVYKKWDEYIRE